ncbi:MULTISPECIES: ABC transporter permease [Azospira]|jgi:ABC-2 type transport system permease protein|uniref:ABC-2 type transporter n=2 Tax=Azospira oryzae TaxID=146939 RepID=G8QJG2_AZOOP|nr:MULTISPECIES: ABC transporter permease subunit [Azospira]TLS17703.1 MAG: ABC transporter permease [Betaproteobacteria bacterium]AEV27631.1 ABC-2 type transporter [Azospira oryzae PS]MBP7488551.1 ABC transporter permease subunit [Azospira sp.]MDK9689532.1 ABC transporter permease [Azospira sp.]RZT90501.1 ABC-2 type transport system permease protein [Azospira oryzae]
MKTLWLTAKLDIVESLRARWFLIYSLVFGGIVALLFAFGLTESRVLGFIGLSRLLVTYIQLAMAILPIFVLVTTVRSVAGDREAGVFEYLLSLPVGLAAWFWGKFLGRYVTIFLPVFVAMLGAVLWALIKGIEVPWGMFVYYTALLAAMAWCFLGIGMLISTLARSTDVAQGTAFMVWLLMLVFLDLILLGVLIQGQVSPETVIGIALANPLQVFRTAALALFDPQLIVLGPSAYVILDTFGVLGYKVYALAYPVLLGSAAALAGFLTFRKTDLP